MELKNIWQNLILNYSNNKKLAEQLWEEISSQYSKKNRVYHNLSHLESMFKEFEKHKSKIENKNLVRFSIFYHDLVYNSARKDNEEKSAKRAREVLEELNLGEKYINECYHQIITTKTHELKKETKGTDIKYLIDFDLEVLSRDWEQYKIYADKIRKEYWIYPNFMYKKGRQKALTSLLERDQIYHTEEYQKELESIARQNINREIAEMLN